MDPACLLLGLLCIGMPGICTVVVLLARASAARRRRTHWPERPRERRCVRCGVAFDRSLERCPQCQLDPLSDAAAELRDLEAAARTVQALRVHGGLDAAICEQVYRCIEARQRLLLNAAQAVPRLADEMATILARMEQWLGDVTRPEKLTVEQQRDLLRGYRLLQEKDLHALSATALEGLARLLATVGLASRALTVYRLLLTKYPGAAGAHQAARDAGQLAYDRAQWALARWFLQKYVDGQGERTPDLEVQAMFEDLRDKAAAGEQSATRAQGGTIPVLLTSPAVAIEQLAPAASAWANIVQAPPAATNQDTPALPVGQTLAEPDVPLPGMPRRSVWAWLAVFMEERNVLWGEVIGGMLIVGCSIALVISLWQTLERVPLFPFLIFAALTSGLLGAGFYTLSHWKLQATSRSLLLIGMLMVPLNFLVLAGLSREFDVEPAEIATAGAAILGFGWLTLRAGRTLVQAPLAESGNGTAWLLVLAILASAVAHLLAPHVAIGVEPSPLALAALGLLASLGTAAGLGIVLARLAARPQWDDGVLRGLFVLVGVGTFAVAAALGFLGYCGADLPDAYRALAVPVAVAGITLLVSGALAYHRTAEQGATAGQAARSALWASVATITALGGIAIQFAAFAMALPGPRERWLAGCVNVLALGATAWSLRLPLLHVPAQVYLLLLVHAGWRDAAEMRLPTPERIVGLFGLVLLQVLAAEFGAWVRRSTDALYYLVGAGVSTALCIAWGLSQPANQSALTTSIIGGIGAIWLLANARWRRVLITYLGLALLFLSTVSYIRRGGPELTYAQLALWSLLVHSTLCALTGIRSASLESRVAWLEATYGQPGRMTALVGSGIAALLLPSAMIDGPTTACIVAGWLATVWLLLAWQESSPVLFTAFQLALSLCIVAGALACTQEAQWLPLQPAGVHASMLGLAALCLLWQTIRRRAAQRERLPALLLPDNLAIEHEVLAMLIIGQLVLAAAGCLPALAEELGQPLGPWMLLPAHWYPHLTDPAAWLLLGLLAATVLIAARPRNLLWPSLGLATLILTVPVLLALGPFAQDRAAASGLRWGMALCFLICSILVWLRGPLERRLVEALPAAALRGLLIAGAVLPVVLLSCVIASLRQRGVAMAGPLAGTLFAQLDGSLSLLTPLAIISAAWAGHGLRDRLPHHFFAGGVLAGATLVAGQLLQAQRIGHAILPEHWVQPLQLGAGFAWAWAILWVIVARRLDHSPSVVKLRDSPLLLVTAHLGSLLLAIILLPAVAAIVFAPPGPTETWVREAGAPGTWLVLGLTAAGVSALNWKRRRFSISELGLLSVTAIAVLASTAERLAAGYGLPALMLGTGSLSLWWAWGAPLLARLGWIGRSALGGNTPLIWCAGPGMVAVLLALVTVIRAEQHYAAAGALILTSLACASLGWQRRREGWAVLCAPLVASAVSLVVWRFHLDEPWHIWTLQLAQIDLAVLGFVGLLCVHCRDRLYAGTLRLAGSPWLLLQMVAALAGNLALLVVAGLALVGSPRNPGPFLAETGTIAGWLALIVNLVAACWYTGLVAPARVIHLVGIGGLLLAILCAATAEAIAPADWLAHHVLTGCWTAVALLILALAWSSHHTDHLGPRLWSPERRAAAARLLRTWLPEAPARAWVTGSSAAVVFTAMLAVWLEPIWPAWSSGNVLAVGILLGALALWAGQPLYSYGSGLTVNVIGLLVYGTWLRNIVHAPGPLRANGELFGTLVSTQVLCFAAAAAAWGCLERWLMQHAPRLSLRNGTLPYAHAALAAALHLLALLVGLAVAMQLAGLAMMDEAAGISSNPLFVSVAEPLAWCALGGLVLASLLCLWDGEYAGVTRYQLYAAGLLAICLVVQALPLAPSTAWYPPLLVGGYVLAVTVLARVHERLPALQRLLPLATGSAQGCDWVFGYQCVLASVVAVLSIVVTFAFAGTVHGLAGPLACLSAAATWSLLVAVWTRVLAPDLSPSALSNVLRDRQFPRYMTLLLAVLLLLQVGGTLTDSSRDSRWLQQSGAALAALASMALAYRLAGRWLASANPWRLPCRILGTALVVAATVMLLSVLALEIAWYDARPEVRLTPLIRPLVMADILAMLLVVALCIYLALTAEEDPLGVPASRRGLYVYAAQAVLLGLLLHLRLNVPDLIPPVLGRYWTVTLMVEAFIGVALGDYFLHRGWPVLAYPLRRTAVVAAFVPVLAYAVQPVAGWQEALASHIAGLQPILRYLHPDRFPGGAPMHALCWLLLGLLHAWLARTRKSPNQLLLAALFINFSVWVLLGTREQLAFLRHPQLWLIPLGLIMLAAEFINRPRLPPWPSSALRALGLLCIYLSSTFDMLLTGLGESVVLPVVLALLSVLGVLLGILLRVRMVLLFGSAFLGVVIFAQIWHAAVDRQQTWIWWASGVVLGLAIVAFFAYFEKHRSEVLKMVDDLRQWR
jgi:hypothetical protein